MSKFPVTLYVGIENEGHGEEEFRDTATDIDDLAIRGGRAVAVYQLKEVVVADLKLEVRPPAYKKAKK